jgi:hypothetical protein
MLPSAKLTTYSLMNHHHHVTSSISLSIQCVSESDETEHSLRNDDGEVLTAAAAGMYMYGAKYRV